MTETHFYFIGAMSLLIIVLELISLLRKQSFETPADMAVRLTSIEQAIQATLQSAAKGEGGLQRIEQQIHTFTESTSTSLEFSRKAIDEKLAQVVEESRKGRAELIDGFKAFETRLEQRLAAVETTLSTRLGELQAGTNSSLEANRAAVDEKLGQTVAESRSGRAELVTAFQAFEGKLEQRLLGFDTSLSGRFETLQQTLASGQEESSKALLAFFAQATVLIFEIRYLMLNI